MQQITLKTGEIYIPCSTLEWDNLSEHTREVLDFGAGGGFELAGRKDEILRIREKLAKIRTSRCRYCGAGDAAHHSYTCPTNLHPDRRSPHERRSR